LPGVFLAINFKLMGFHPNIGWYKAKLESDEVSTSSDS